MDGHRLRREAVTASNSLSPIASMIRRKYSPARCSNMEKIVVQGQVRRSCRVTW